LKNVKIYREKASKPKGVYSVRVSDEDAEFLKTFHNMSELFHDFLEGLKNEERKLESKGIPIEVIKEVAEAHVKIFMESHERRRDLNLAKGWEEEDALELWNNGMGSVLLDVAALTLKTPSPFWPEKIMYPGDEQLDDVLLHLQSREAKAFIQKIKDNVSHSEKLTPLTEDEINIVRKIFDETKHTLEVQYRRKFHLLPRELWHQYVTDWRKPTQPRKLRYQLP
jgi:hypothetical protein